MKVLVLVKGVAAPGTQPLADDGCLEGVDQVLDHYSKYALEAGLQLIQEDDQGSVTVASYGAGAETALRDALALGAQDAVLVTTNQKRPRLGQVFATVVDRSGPFDLVLCGDQASDDSQGVLPAQVAAALGWPLIDLVDELGMNGARLAYLSSLDQGTVKGTVQLPAVVAVTDTINKPRLPSFKLKMAAKRFQIKGNRVESDGVDALESLGLETMPASNKSVRMVDTVDDLIQGLDQVGIRLRKE